MLKITVSDLDYKFEDIEEQFDLMDGIEDTTLNRDILKEIEQSTYLDKYNILDRFGCKLSIRYISTGCKAALLVANTDKTIDLVECGYNARDCIIKKCNKGGIKLYSLGITVEGADETPIDVELNEINFKTLGEFNRYIREEY